MSDIERLRAWHKANDLVVCPEFPTSWGSFCPVCGSRDPAVRSGAHHFVPKAFVVEYTLLGLGTNRVDRRPWTTDSIQVWGAEVVALRERHGLVPCPSKS